MSLIVFIGMVAITATLTEAQNDELPANFNTSPDVFRSEIRDDAGQYSLSYQTVDGLAHSEQGLLKINSEGTGNVLVKQGSYTYLDANGTPITINYIADENGFQPTGMHLPQPPVQPPPLPSV